MVGCPIYTVTSVLTQQELDLHFLTYNIPAELRLEVPDRNSTIKDSPEGKIGMYTHFIEFANYRIRLSKFLLCVLEYYQINLSQLSVIGAAKVSHFEITCHALVCPLSIPWFDGTSVVKDPLLVDEVVDLPCVELLNEKRTLIRKYLETFLCLVGLSCSFVETNIRPTLLRDDDEEMGLLDFVRAVDPFKVKVGERTLAENEVPLVTKTEDRVVSPSSQTICLVDHTIQDELNVNSGCNISHFEARVCVSNLQKDGPLHRVLLCAINSSNILLDENWKAKISDFGLSKFGHADQQMSIVVTHPAGTPGVVNDKEESDLLKLVKESYEQNRIEEKIVGTVSSIMMKWINVCPIDTFSSSGSPFNTDLEIIYRCCSGQIAFLETDCERDVMWTDEELEQTAAAVGYGVVKYAELKNNRLNMDGQGVKNVLTEKLYHTSKDTLPIHMLTHMEEMGRQNSYGWARCPYWIVEKINN
ncbi:gypsy type transposase [Tanacetum coccineum]